MFEQGIEDTLKTCAKEVMRSNDNQDPSKGIDEASSQLDLFISIVENQGTKDDLIQAAKSVKAILPKLWHEVNT